MPVATIPAPPAPPSASNVVARSPAKGAQIEALAFATSPTLFATCCFAFGILCTRFLYEPPPLALLMVLLAAVVTIAGVRYARRLSLLPLFVTWMAAGIFCSEIRPLPASQKALLPFESGKASSLLGEVVRAGPVRAVETTAPFAPRAVKEKSQSLDLRIERIADSAGRYQPVTGGLRVTLYASEAETFAAVRCGEVLRVLAAIHPPERYNDPGVWNSAGYLLDQGIGALASTRRSAATVVPAVRTPSFACRLKTLQQSASERIMELADKGPDFTTAPRLSAFFRLTAEDASMLAAVITGDRSWLRQRTRVGFERTGSFHLLVVSGLHLAIFAGIILWLARRVGLPRVAAALLTIASALAYAVFTGFGQPVQRSLWMVTLYLLGRLLWRERSALNAIGFAALCLLAANPAALFDAGFQMTLLSVIAIAGVAAPLAERSFVPYLRATRNLSLIAIDPALPPRIAQFRVCLRLLGTHLKPLVGGRFAFAAPALLIRLALRICELLLASIVVEAVMSLPMAVYFHRVTVLALPVNFLIVPFLGLLLPSAMLTFATLLVSAKLALAPAALTAALLHTVTALIYSFANMRVGDLRIPRPAPPSIAAFLFLLGFAVYAARLRRFAIPASIAALAVMAATAIFPYPIQREAGKLEITAIDVGQGDSLLIVTPEAKTLLIDAGGSPFGPPSELANFDVGEEVVSAYLWSRGIRRLDAVALTHAHADHIGGMPAVLANFRPKEVWIGVNPHSSAYDAFLAEAASVGAVTKHYTAGSRFQFGGAEVAVLAPEPDYLPGPVPTNNDSLVLRIQYGQTSALLEGDAEGPSENRMLHDGLLRSDLLKVGHHGSLTSSNPPFLAAVAPAYAVISVGARNLYGHPRIEVLEQLQAGHVRTYRTDTIGLFTFYLDGTRVMSAPLPRPAD